VCGNGAVEMRDPRCGGGLGGAIAIGAQDGEGVEKRKEAAIQGSVMATRLFPVWEWW
jgi:hypothetical protein